MIKNRFCKILLIILLNLGPVTNKLHTEVKLDYKKIYSEASPEKLVIVNDTNEKIDIVVTYESVVRNYTKTKNNIEKTILSAKNIIIEKPFRIKSKDNDQEFPLDKVIIKIKTEGKLKKLSSFKEKNFGQIIFIREINEKDNFKCQNVNCKNLKVRKNKKSYIQGKCGWEIKTKLYMENNTTKNVKGFIKYKIELPGRGDVSGTLDNGGNRKKITCGDFRDIQNFKVYYYRQDKEGVYRKINKKPFEATEKKQRNIKYNKENRLVFRFIHSKKKMRLNVVYK